MPKILLNRADPDSVEEFYASIVESSQKQAVEQMTIVVGVCIIKTLCLSVLFGVGNEPQEIVGIDMGIRAALVCILFFFIVHIPKLIHDAEVLEQF